MAPGDWMRRFCHSSSFNLRRTTEFRTPVELRVQTCSFPRNSYRARLVLYSDPSSDARFWDGRAFVLTAPNRRTTGWNFCRAPRGRTTNPWLTGGEPFEKGRVRFFCSWGSRPSKIGSWFVIRLAKLIVQDVHGIPSIVLIVLPCLIQ